MNNGTKCNIVTCICFGGAHIRYRDMDVKTEIYSVKNGDLNPKYY